LALRRKAHREYKIVSTSASAGGFTPKPPACNAFTATGILILLLPSPPRYGSTGKQPERLGDAGGIAAFTLPALQAAEART